MIYGYIPEWMRTENPPFARAVACYYSIEYGQRKAAIKGELAYSQAAYKIADRLPAQIPILALQRRIDRAVREGDEDFLARLSDAVRLSRKKSKLNEKNPSFIEYIFEAYYFLRKRDGEGSPLPTKAEVKNTTALIAAFDMEGLSAKLPEYLWRNRGLTEKQFQRIEGVRQRLVDDRQHHWPQRLAEAGLRDLPQKKRGGK